jgi:predicted SprT family Zn-dependent metalloprotease
VITNKAKKRVLQVVGEWVPIMGLEWYTINHQFNEATDSSDEQTQATTNTTWYYREATMTWHLPKLALLEDDELENVVVHELVHILLDPIHPEGDGINHHLEYATECLARALLAARKA